MFLSRLISPQHPIDLFGSLTKNTEGGLKLLQRFKFKNGRCQLLSQIFSLLGQPRKGGLNRLMIIGIGSNSCVFNARRNSGNPFIFGPIISSLFISRDTPYARNPKNRQALLPGYSV